MKRIALSLAASLLYSTIALALPADSVLSAPPSGACVSAEATTTASFAADFEQNLTPAPLPQSITQAWCQSKTSVYCTYNGWNKITHCCWATYIAPQAYCPTICE